MAGDKKEEQGTKVEPMPSTGRGSDDDFDTILKRLGTGRWQALWYIAYAYWSMTTSYHIYAGAFLAPSVEHFCRPPPHALTATLILPREAAHNATTYTTGVSLYDATCRYLSEDPDTGRLEELPCTEWDFDNTTFTSTVTSEFGLVCEHQYLRAVYQSIYLGGTLLGACLNTFLADWYGRWNVAAISTVSFTVIALGSAWLPSMSLLLAARFLLGTMHNLSFMSCFILVTEITEIKRRSMVGLVVPNFFSVGTMLWGLWAYLERDWRWLQTYVSFFCPAFLPVLLFLPESPRWLAVMGHHKHAVSVLQRAARVNGTTLPPTDHLLEIMKGMQHPGKRQAGDRSNVPLRRLVINQVTCLFRNSKLRTITICICICHFSVNMIYFALTLGASVFDVNPFMYMAISGLMETPSFVIFFLVDAFGHKKSSMGFMGLCAASLFLQPLTPNRLKWLSTTLVMVSKLFAFNVVSLLYLYTSELYPTEIRTLGMSASMIASRISGIIAPFFISALESSYPWIISVMLGLAAVVTGFCYVPLRETVNTSLPDTVTQVEVLTVHRTCKQHTSE